MGQGAIAALLLLGMEPTEAEMFHALGDKQETFLNGWTIRRCMDCGKPVAGGPTRCVLCADIAGGEG
jgi:hypothetical protein